MKTTLLTTLLACLMTVGMVAQADARPRHHQQTVIYVSGYQSCGTPIYTEKRFCGYNRWGRPIWDYRVLRPGEYRNGYGRRASVYRGNGYGYRDQGCSPHRARYGNRVIFQGNIRL